MRREVGAAGRVEIGGILMAEQIEPGHFRLADFTIDGQRGGAAHFVRSVEHLQAALTDFFEQTGSDFGRFNYLGEWHSHPNHAPIPSREDVASMISLVEGERDIPFALLLIVRRTWRSIAMSASLFERDQPPRPFPIHAE
jgi:integrative and conjugative element protein (TIGR02256 family)